MSSLIAGFITREKINEIKNALDAKAARGDEKGAKGFSFTISVNDSLNDYGQNCSMFAEQSKEQRDAKAPKFYIGNGKVFWTDGSIKVASKEEATPAPQAAPAPAGDLPF